jgi:hypothetical protein
VVYGGNRTKKALRRLDWFCIITGTLFGIWALFFVINLGYGFPQSTLNNMLTIYAAFGAIFIIVLNVASGVYAITTLRFVAKGQAGIQATPGQLAAQRLSQTLRAIQAISVTAILILIANYILDPLGQNAVWSMSYLMLYRGVMWVGYLAILPVMGKVKASVGPAGMTQRGSQINLGSQIQSTGGEAGEPTLGSTAGGLTIQPPGSTLAPNGKSPRFGTARASGGWTGSARASANFSSARASQKWSPNTNRLSMTYGQRNAMNARASGYAINLGPPQTIDQLRAQSSATDTNTGGNGGNNATSPSLGNRPSSTNNNGNGDHKITSGPASSTTSPRMGERPPSAERERGHGRGVLNSRRAAAAATSPPLRALAPPNTSAATSPPPIAEKRSPALRTFDSLGEGESPAITASPAPTTQTPELNLASGSGHEVPTSLASITTMLAAAKVVKSTSSSSNAYAINNNNNTNGTTTPPVGGTIAEAPSASFASGVVIAPGGSNHSTPTGSVHSLAVATPVTRPSSGLRVESTLPLTISRPLDESSPLLGRRTSPPSVTATTAATAATGIATSTTPPSTTSSAPVPPVN